MKKILFIISFLITTFFIFSCKQNIDPTVSTITISSLPENINYYQNDTLNFSGLEIQEVYSDGSFKLITDYTTIPAENSLLTKAGKQKVTIQFDGYETSFYISVSEISITNLSIFSYPDKQIYKVGEGLSFDGLLLLAEYNNGTEKYITENQVTASPSEDTILDKTGTKTIQFKYLNKKTTYSVIIQEKDPEYSEIPEITEHPEDIKTSINNTVTLNVTTNEPEEGTIEYEWYKSDQIYNSFELLTGENKSILTLTNNGQETVEYYYCIVKNRTTGKLVSEIRSNIAYVEFVNPVTILSQSEDVNFELYSEYNMPTFQVQYKVNLPGTIKVEWYKRANIDENNDELLKEEIVKDVFSDKGCVFTTEYKVPDDEFSEHEVNTREIYSKYIFNEDLITTVNQKVTISMPDTGLMCLYINTDSGEDPTGRYLKDEGLSNYYEVADRIKLPGQLQIYKNKECIYNSDKYLEGQSGIKIKLRGNGSAYKDQKPFKIKLENKADLLFRDNEVFMDKDWVLLAEGYSLDTLFGLIVSKEIGFCWVPKYEFVDLVMNGTYRGTYMLVESIEKNNDCKINLDESGFLIECESKCVAEAKYNQIEPAPIYFKSDSGKYFSFKFPDDDDLTSLQISYIQNKINNFENSLTNGDYKNYIDLNSWTAWHIVHDIVGQKDSGGTNKYISLFSNDDSCLLKMETPWDFQHGQIRSKIHNWSKLHELDSSFYSKNLFENTNTDFKSTYQTKWKEISSDLQNSLFNDFDIFSQKYSLSIDNSRQLDSIRWNRTDSSVESDINTIKEWISERIEWINENIDTL